MARASAKKGAPPGPAKRRGRPTKGPRTHPGKISVGASLKLKAFVVQMAADMEGTEADVIREGLRLLAEARGLPRPPLR